MPLTKMGHIYFHKKVRVANWVLVIGDHDLTHLTAEGIPIHCRMARNAAKLSGVTDQNAVDPACRKPESRNEAEVCVLKPSVVKWRNTHTT